MKILITGITGLFGSYLAAEFSKLGEIHGFCRPGTPQQLFIDDEIPVIWHQGDLNDPESIADALEGIDLVIHSAGLVSFSSADSQKVYQVNHLGTANLVDTMLALGVKKLVYVSSVAAIGRVPDVKVMDEDAKWTDSPLNTDYANSKYLGELEVRRAEQEGLQVCVVNPSIILGKSSYGKSSTAIYSYVLEGNKFYPKGDLNFVDVRDAAELTRRLVEGGHWGERFILNAAAISYREFFEEVAVAFDKKAPSLPLSSWMIHVASIGSFILRKMGLSKSPLNRQTAMLAQQKIAYSNEKVKNLLGFKFRSLPESLQWAKNP